MHWTVGIKMRTEFPYDTLIKSGHMVCNQPTPTYVIVDIFSMKAFISPSIPKLIKTQYNWTVKCIVG